MNRADRAQMELKSTQGNIELLNRSYAIHVTDFHMLLMKYSMNNVLKYAVRML